MFLQTEALLAENFSPLIDSYLKKTCLSSPVLPHKNNITLIRSLSVHPCRLQSWNRAGATTLCPQVWLQHPSSFSFFKHVTFIQVQYLMLAPEAAGPSNGSVIAASL